MKAAATILILLLFAAKTFAQNNNIPKDTSFTIYSTLIKEQKKRPYIEIATPQKPDDILIKTELTYKEIAGRKIRLDIYCPKKTNKLKPAVLLVFGGGWRSGDKNQNVAMSIELAKNGYVAVSPEYRLSLEASYPAAVYDLKAAIRWMRANAKKYGIDTTKIAILGCSAGGQLAALVGNTNGNPSFEDAIGNANYSSNVQAVVDIDGTLAFHHPESVEGAAAAQWLGGTYVQKPEIWEEAAPLNHVTNKTPPFIFLNSSTPRFHAGRTDMIKKMDSLHIYSEIHTFEDTPHPFWFFNPWFNPMMGFIVTFLHKEFK